MYWRRVPRYPVTQVRPRQASRLALVLRIRIRTTPPARSYDAVFRLYDDGVGFRYEFPDQPRLRQVRIGEELTEFDIAEPATAWWIPAGEWNREEYLYHRTPLQEVGDAQTPSSSRCTW